MGIPRLTQDIAPFAETVTIRNGRQRTGTQFVNKVVIDGPSLIYYVYYRVLNIQQSDDVPSSLGSKDCCVLPPYSIINEAVVDILELLRDHGVAVLRIFFDGGLPAAKQLTRHERLERSRAQLESFRSLNSRNPPCRTYRFAHQHNGFSSELWQIRASSSPTIKLPVPPFIVPSAIEHLMQISIWRDVIETVDGESDSYCACLAAQTGAAVLSSDSDLVVYDLGGEGSVVQLGSLQLVDDDDDVGQVLKGSCYRPKVVAAGLGVVSLPDFAYQRSMDSQATSRVIAQRTQSFQVPSQLQSLSYTAFIEEYKHPISFNGSISMSPQVWSALDPRSAELLCAIGKDQPLRVYLPVLFEDPSRDSSWTYGREQRQIAYSVLLNYLAGERAESKFDHVAEFARNGRAIKESTLPILSLQQTVDRLEELLADLQICDQLSSAEQPKLLKYYIFGAAIVQKRKSTNAKSCMVQLFRLMALRKRATFAPTWDDIHILANVQAVLYSLRMIKQLSKYALQSLPPLPLLYAKVQAILRILADMPPIQELFLEATHIWLKFQDFPTDMRYSAYHMVESTSGSGISSQEKFILDSPEAKPAQRPSSFVRVRSKTQAGMQASGHQKRREFQSPTSDSINKVANKMVSKARASSNNPFDLLDQA